MFVAVCVCQQGRDMCPGGGITPLRMLFLAQEKPLGVGAYLPNSALKLGPSGLSEQRGGTAIKRPPRVTDASKYEHPLPDPLQPTPMQLWANSDRNRANLPWPFQPRHRAPKRVARSRGGPAAAQIRPTRDQPSPRNAHPVREGRRHWRQPLNFC